MSTSRHDMTMSCDVMWTKLNAKQSQHVVHIRKSACEYEAHNEYPPLGAPPPASGPQPPASGPQPPASVHTYYIDTFNWLCYTPWSCRVNRTNTMLCKIPDHLPDVFQPCNDIGLIKWAREHVMQIRWIYNLNDLQTMQAHSFYLCFIENSINLLNFQ